MKTQISEQLVLQVAAEAMADPRSVRKLLINHRPLARLAQERILAALRRLGHNGLAEEAAK